MKKRFQLLALLMALLITACQPAWEFSLFGLGEERLVNRQVWESYADFGDGDKVPLEQILYGLGARIIAEITITDPDGKQFSFVWEEVCAEAWIEKGGSLLISGLEIVPDQVEISLSPWEEEVEIEITDLAPAASASLGIAPPELAAGQSREVPPADAVLLLFLDGFGYLRYQESLAAGLIPELAKLDPPLVGLTTYPPVTTVSTASLLLGTEPMIHGVETRGIRKTDQETLFDVAAAADLEISAVEGEALAFILRGAELTLSGDKDGNGGTDDNVLGNALSVLQEGMPDLFYIHFHGIDDQGHEVGPGAPAEIEKIREVDAAVGQILEQLPPGTLVIIFADHGMHRVEGDGRLGNHGHLISRDMLIPVWIITID